MVERGGFTLVEVTVAMVLLAVGILGIASSAVLATRLQRDGAVQGEAATRASVVLDSLIADSTTASGTFQTPAYELDWLAAGDSVNLSVRTPDSSNFSLRARR